MDPNVKEFEAAKSSRGMDSMDSIDSMDSVDTVETLWSLGSTAGHMDNTVESDQVGRSTGSLVQPPQN